MSQYGDYSTYETLPSGRTSTISFYRSPDGAIRLATTPIAQSIAQPIVHVQEAAPLAVAIPNSRRQSVLIQQNVATPLPVVQQSQQLVRAQSALSLDSAPIELAPAPAHSLTVATTQGLQLNASKYMQNQEGLLNSMKLTMDQMKQLDQEMEDNMELLQDNFKRAQEALGKKMQADSKALKERIDAKKQQLQKRMEQLGELNQEAQKKYFESQENTITQYKKTMQKQMQ